MDIGSGATILVNVELEGVEQGKAALNAFGTVGEASANRVQAAYKQVAASAMDFARAGANANQIAQLTGVSMREARDATALYAKTLATAENEVHGLRLANQELAESGFLKVTNATKTVTSAAGAAAPALNSVRASMTAMTASALQAFPGVAQVASALGNFAIGAGPMIAVLAGIAAVTAAWKAWHEGAKEAREEQEKLTKSLLEWYDKQKLGAAGEFPKQIDAMIAKVKELRGELDKMNSGGVIGAAGAVGAGGSRVAAWIRAATGFLGSGNTAQLAVEMVKGTAATVDAVKKGGDAIVAAREEVAKRLNQQTLDQMEGMRQLRESQYALWAQQIDPIVAGLKKLEVAYSGITAKLLAAEKAGNATKEIWQQMRAGKSAPAPIGGVDTMPGDWIFTLPKSENYAKVWRDGIGKIVTDGFKSFHDFFEDVFQLFNRLLDKMQAAGKGDSFGAKLLGLGSAAISGGLAGYGVGGQIGNAAGGALGGAAAGALAGSAFGVPGAIVGGLAGAAAGLIGGANAHKEAAQRLREAADALHTSITNFSLQGGNPVAASLESLHQQMLAIHDAQLKLFQQTTGADSPLYKVGNGSANEAYFAEQERLSKAYADQVAKISADFWNGIAAALNALDGPAGAYRNALAEQDRWYKEALESARVLGATESQLNDIRRVHEQTIESLRRAEENRIQQISTELAIREAVAGGQDKYANELRIRAQQEAEVFAAERDHWSDEQIARLKNVQAMEDQRRALDEATAAAERNAAAQSGYQERFLRATGQNDALFAFQQAAERAKAMLDLAKGIIDRTTFDWLVMAQGAEAAAREADKQAAAAQRVVDSQRQAIQLQQRAVDEQIRGAEQILNATRQAIDSVRKYIDSSKLSNISPLGPEARFEEAKRQYLALSTRANQGDVKAFAELPDAVEKYRQEAVNMFASTAAARDVFNSTQIYLESLTDKFGVQATIQEQILATLNAQKAVLDAQLARLQPSGIPQDIANAIPKAQIPDVIGGPYRPPPLRDLPGIDPRKRPLWADDLIGRIDRTNSHLSDIGAKAFTQVDYAGRLYGVVATTASTQTEYQRQIASSARETADGIRRGPIGNGNGGL